MHWRWSGRAEFNDKPALPEPLLVLKLTPFRSTFEGVLWYNQRRSLEPQSLINSCSYAIFDIRRQGQKIGPASSRF